MGGISKSETIAIIRSLLSSTKSNYSVSRLNIEFKKETGIDIPVFGYGTLSDFLHSIPDTVKVSGLYPVEEVSLVRNDKSAHIVSLVRRTKIPEPKKQICKNQSGNYRNVTFQKNPNASGRKDQEKFRGKKISSLLKLKETECSCPLESSCDKISLKNFLDFEESIPPIDIKLHAQVGDCVEVCPYYICSPHKFYFHFKKFKKKFAHFIDKMQRFYETTESIPEMTEGFIKPKLTCAVFHKIHNEVRWHRGEIDQVISKSHVYVKFIDYGHGAKVSVENLQFLHKDFSSLPRQAVLGSLANIRPSKGEFGWSLPAVKRFSSLALQKDLVAKVVEMDDSACSVKVALYSTIELELQINDTLVEEGHAEYTTDILNNSSGLIYGKSWKGKFSKIQPTSYETDLTEKDAMKSVGIRPMPVLETPICFSSGFFDNKRLKKLFYTGEKK